LGIDFSWSIAVQFTDLKLDPKRLNQTLYAAGRASTPHGELTVVATAVANGQQVIMVQLEANDPAAGQVIHLGTFDTPRVVDLLSVLGHRSDLKQGRSQVQGGR